MAHLYVCNATPRNHDLNFRLPKESALDPEGRKVFHLRIPAGGQKDVAHINPGNPMSDADVEHVLKQMPGARTVSEASAAKGFSGLIYSKLRAIDVDAIHAGLGETDQVAIARALESRKTNAMAADHELAVEAQKAGGEISALEVSVKEDVKPGDNSDTERKDETIQVERPGAPARKRKN